MSRTHKEEMEALNVITDMVNHPPHYTEGGIETLDVIKAKMTKTGYEGYLLGNVLKYILRCEYKDKRKEDILKAQFYLNELAKDI